MHDAACGTPDAFTVGICDARAWRGGLGVWGFSGICRIQARICARARNRCARRRWMMCCGGCFWRVRGGRGGLWRADSFPFLPSDRPLPSSASLIAGSDRALPNPKVSARSSDRPPPCRTIHDPSSHTTLPRWAGPAGGSHGGLTGRATGNGSSDRPPPAWAMRDRSRDRRTFEMSKQRSG